MCIWLPQSLWHAGSSLQRTDGLVLVHGLSRYGARAWLLSDVWDLSFSTRVCTHVCCIAKWILNYLPTGDIPVLAYWQSYFPVLEIR